MDSKINSFFDNYNLDIRETGDQRFSDQKVKIDNLRTVSDIILEVADSFHNSFNKNNIWFSGLSKELVPTLYSKPELDNPRAKNEYDKFFAQPLKTLGYSKVLDERKVGNVNYYSINNKEILNYISINNINSFNFLNSYYEKVLKDSEIFYLFENFFKNQDSSSFINLKERYIDFIINYTRVNKRTEPARIFNPMLNILSFKRQKKGTERGFISKHNIKWIELMYNRENWRDTSKPKNLTRREHYLNFTQFRTDESSLNYEERLSVKNLKKYHSNRSEIPDNVDVSDGVHAHHIFPKSEFPLLRGHKENLILLTPSQHLNEAHRGGNTRYISQEYQIRCLKQKIRSVSKSIEDGDGFYSKEDLIDVLNTGKNTDIFNLEDKFDILSDKLNTL